NKPKCPKCGNKRTGAATKDGYLRCMSCDHEAPRKEFTTPATVRESLEQLMEDAGFQQNSESGPVVITGFRGKRFVRDDQRILKVNLDEEELAAWEYLTRKGKLIASGYGFDSLRNYLIKEDFEYLEEWTKECMKKMHKKENREKKKLNE